MKMEVEGGRGGGGDRYCIVYTAKQVPGIHSYVYKVGIEILRTA